MGIKQLLTMIKNKVKNVSKMYKILSTQELNAQKIYFWGITKLAEEITKHSLKVTFTPL